MMKHFKTPVGEIRAIDKGQDFLISDDWQELNSDQLAVELEARKPAPTPEQIRDKALSELTHDFGDGRVIQIRPFQFSPDEANIRNAIERMGRKAQALQPWKMADDTIAMLTKQELQKAIESGQDQTAQIWSDYFAAVAG